MPGHSFSLELLVSQVPLVSDGSAASEHSCPPEKGASLKQLASQQKQLFLHPESVSLSPPPVSFLPRATAGDCLESSYFKEKPLRKSHLGRRATLASCLKAKDSNLENQGV